MRIALYSDLHRECATYEAQLWKPPTIDVDVVILAGDIGSHTRGLTWASAVFQQPVVYVAGNHEYYDAHLGMCAAFIAERMWRLEGREWREDAENEAWGKES